jgi:hypothetical protein
MRTLEELIDTYGLPKLSTGWCGACHKQITTPVWAFSLGGNVIEEASHLLSEGILSQEELDLMVHFVNQNSQI